jgi:hypothetical protein
LRSLPLAFEARAAGSRVTGFSANAKEPPEAQIQRLFTASGAEWLQLRHAEAGCFIACIEAPRVVAQGCQCGAAA